MFVGRLAGMVGFRTHTFTRILGKMDYLSRIKSDKSNKILKYIESFVWMINHAGNRRPSYVSDKDYELMQKSFAIIYRNSIVH